MYILLYYVYSHIWYPHDSSAMIVWHKKLEVRHQNCAVKAEAWHGSGMFSCVGTCIAYICACAYIVMIFTIILLLLLYLISLIEAGTILWNICVYICCRQSWDNFDHLCDFVHQSVSKEVVDVEGTVQVEVDLHTWLCLKACNLICNGKRENASFLFGIPAGIETDIQIFSWSSSFAYRMYGWFPSESYRLDLNLHLWRPTSTSGSTYGSQLRPKPLIPWDVWSWLTDTNSTFCWYHWREEIKKCGFEVYWVSGSESWYF